jgi:hypothetical protein
MSRKHHVFYNESDTIRVADDVISVADDTLRIADHELRGGRKPTGSERVNAYRTNSGRITGSGQEDHSASTWRSVWKVLWWRGQ